MFVDQVRFYHGVPAGDEDLVPKLPPVPLRLDLYDYDIGYLAALLQNQGCHTSKQTLAATSASPITQSDSDLAIRDAMSAAVSSVVPGSSTVPVLRAATLSSHHSGTLNMQP